MDKVFSHGQMVAVTKANTMKIKSMGLVYIHGRTADNTLVNGKMGSNMAKVFIRMCNK
jgi:hypothetical protein